MMRKNIRTATFAIVLGLCLGASGAALAGTAYGSYGYYGPQAGYSYQNFNQISTGSGDPQSWIWIQTQSGSSVPSGYMGGVPRLYKGGSLCATGSATYNSGPTSSMGVPVFQSCGSGAYYADGSSYAWTGTSYNTYTSYSSPSQNH